MPKQLQKDFYKSNEKKEVSLEYQISPKIVCLKDLEEESKFAFKIDI